MIPWFGVMCLGYGLGFIFRQDSEQRRRSVLLLALGFLAAFVMLRAINGYGDPAPWSVHSSAIMTAAVVHQRVQVSAVIDVRAGDARRLDAVVPRAGRVDGNGCRHSCWRSVARRCSRMCCTSMWRIASHCFIGALGGLSASYYVRLPVALRWRSGRSGLRASHRDATWLAVLLLLYPVSSWFARVKRERRDWWLELYVTVPVGWH